MLRIVGIWTLKPIWGYSPSLLHDHTQATIWTLKPIWGYSPSLLHDHTQATLCNLLLVAFVRCSH